MKVLHVLDRLSFSGAELMYLSAANYFQENDCQFYVLNTSIILGEFSSFFEKAGCRVIHYPYVKSLAGKFAFYNLLKTFFNEEGIDVVHVHRDDLKFEIAFCAWICGIKCVCTHHSIYRSNWYSIGYHCFQRWVMTNLFGCCQHSISNSVFENEKTYYCNDTILINNWYDNKKFYPALEGEKNIVRKEFGISQDAKVLISVGSCRKLKRHKDIIDTVAILKRKYPDVCYLHLGDGDLLEEEKCYAKQKGVSSNTHFIGNQLDVRKYIIAADIYVMTSLMEGLSLSTIEAMACGVPTVLYDVPGLKDFNLEKECSLQVKESPVLLANACLLLFQDIKRARQLVEDALRLVHLKFDLETNVKEMHALYKE